MKNYNSQNSINRIAIGVLIVLIAVFCCLSLFGALGGVGKMVSSFLIGAFGYASYAYFICALLIGVAIIFNFRINLEGKKILGLSLLLIAGIWALHVYTSSANTLTNGYGGYLNACYKNQNTAGGALFGIISYPFQRFFTNVGALAFTCVLFFISVFFAVFPFIRGASTKSRGLKLRKKPRGEKITAPKVPTLTSFDDAKPPTFYKLTENAAEEPPKNTVGAEGYNPIFPNENGHIEDEEKIDGRGLKYALGGEEMNDRERNRSFGLFRSDRTVEDKPAKSGSGNIVRDMLFGEIDNEKYKEYLNGRRANEHNIDDPNYDALQNAYKNTMAREPKGSTMAEPQSLTDAINNAEAKRKGVGEVAAPAEPQTAVPNPRQAYDYYSGLNGMAPQIYRNSAKNSGGSRFPVQNNNTQANANEIKNDLKNTIEFEKLKEEQRELFRENSKIRQSQFDYRTNGQGGQAQGYVNTNPTSTFGNAQPEQKPQPAAPNVNNVSAMQTEQPKTVQSEMRPSGFAFIPSHKNDVYTAESKPLTQSDNPNGYYSVNAYRGEKSENSFADVKNFNDKHLSAQRNGQNNLVNDFNGSFGGTNTINSGYGQNGNRGYEETQSHGGYGLNSTNNNPNGYQSVASQYAQRNSSFADNLNQPAANLFGDAKQTWSEMTHGGQNNDRNANGYNNYQSNQMGGNPMHNQYDRGNVPQQNGYNNGGYNSANNGYGSVGGYNNNNGINGGMQGGFNSGYGNSAYGANVNPYQPIAPSPQPFSPYPQPTNFGATNFTWTPNGYVPIQPVPVVSPSVVYQPIQVVPTQVGQTETIQEKPKTEIKTDELKPLQSSSFALNPTTGVYSNPNSAGTEKTFAPDYERGKRLNAEAEVRRIDDEAKRDRLKRMEELKRRQAERNAKRAAEEQKQQTAAESVRSEQGHGAVAQKLNFGEYNDAVERARANAEVLKPNPSDNRIVSNSGNTQSQSGGSMWRSVGELGSGISAEEKAKRGFGAFAGTIGGFGGGNSLRRDPSSFGETQNSGNAMSHDFNATSVQNRGYADNFESASNPQNEFNKNVNEDFLREEEEERLEAERIEAERAKYLERRNRKRNKPEDPKVRTAQITIEESIEKTEPRAPYVAPPIDLLIPPEIKTGPGEDIEEKKEALITTLAYFNVKAKIFDVVCGPAFSLFRLTIEEMPRGKTINWLQSLENDLAMKMAEISVKVLTPIPGENFVGVEVSNKNRRLVRISSILRSQEFENAKSPVSFALGEDIYGKNYVCEVRNLPHMLVAGQTGAGKSCCINTLIVSMLYHASPDDVRFIMIDPKRTELSIYKGIPHLLLDDIIYDADKAIKALQWSIDEMQRRIDFFNKNGYRDIEEYNACKLQDDFVPMPRIIIIIDELAELMDRGSKTVENCIDRLARLARAVGIHLICATQRPSVDVVSGTIKNNLPSRIAFRVPTQGDSRTVLGVGGAENLLGDGDLLYMNPKMKSSVRVQGAFIDTPEVKAVVDFLKEHNTCIYDSKIKDEIYKEEEKEEPQTDNGGKKQSAITQELIDALRIGLDGVPLSISMLQRKLGVGFPKAGKIYDQIERMGYFGPPSKPNGARPVTITQEEYDDLVAEFEGDNE